MDNWIRYSDKIERPVYITVMVNAMTELINIKDFKYLDRWVVFCKWVLSHSDPERVDGLPNPSDESKEYPDWGSPRRAVVDFIEACVKKDIEVPFSVRDGLAQLLYQTCTQSDWRLDNNQLVLLNRNDPLSEAINQTRSIALGVLLDFGFWVRRNLPEDTLLEVTNILSDRISKKATFSLTQPEYAILGMHFSNLCTLNKNWAIEHKAQLFPQSDASLWLVAFESYICSNRPNLDIFNILKSEFEFALQNFSLILINNDNDSKLVKRLGQHFLSYYLWEAYPLRGEDSFLEGYYQKTANDRKYWAMLFDHLGHLLGNSGKRLAIELTDRVISFFNWRFDISEPLELREFTFWLEADCLDSQWRLSTYSKILSLKYELKNGLYTELKTLNQLLLKHPSLTVECFEKITKAIEQGTHLYLPVDGAKSILKFGLKSEESQVREHAKRARENLLRLGRFDFLDLD